VRQCCCCFKRRCCCCCCCCCSCTCCCRERGPSATGCHICESCCAVERAMQLVRLRQTPASASGSSAHPHFGDAPAMVDARRPAGCITASSKLPLALRVGAAESARPTPPVPTHTSERQASPHRHAFARTRAYAESSHAAPKIKARTTASPASLSPLLPPVEKDTCQLRHTRTHTRVEELGHATHTHTHTHTDIHTYTRRAGKHHTHTRART
jgi:hypothetical protein